jgi:hypothetical protein
MKLGVNLIIAVILKAPSSNGEAQSKESKIPLKKDCSNKSPTYKKHSLLYRCGACVPEVIVMSCFKMKIMFPIPAYVGKEYYFVEDMSDCALLILQEVFV